MASLIFVSVGVVILCLCSLLASLFLISTLGIRYMSLTVIKIDYGVWHFHLLRQHSFIQYTLLLQPASSQLWHKSVVFPQGCHLFLLCLDSPHIAKSVGWVRLFASWNYHQMCQKGESTRCLFARKKVRVRESKVSPEFLVLMFDSALSLGVSELTLTFHFSHYSWKLVNFTVYLRSGLWCPLVFLESCQNLIKFTG